MKLVVIILFVPNKHVKRFAKLVVLAVIRTGKIAIKKAIECLVNWLND